VVVTLCVTTAFLAAGAATATETPVFTAYAFAASIRWDVTGSFAGTCSTDHRTVTRGAHGKLGYPTGSVRGTMHITLRTVKPASVAVAFVDPARVPTPWYWPKGETTQIDGSPEPGVAGGLPGRAVVTVRNTGTVPVVCAPIVVDPAQCHSTFGAKFQPLSDTATHDGKRVPGKAQVLGAIGITGFGQDYRQTFCFVQAPGKHVAVSEDLGRPIWWPGRVYPPSTTITVPANIRDCNVKRFTVHLTLGDTSQVTGPVGARYGTLESSALRGTGTLTLTRIKGWRETNYLPPKVPGAWGCGGTVRRP
jgi:hypothetical protein